MVTATFRRRKHPVQFGRRSSAAAIPAQPQPGLAEDIRLFATFFLGGLAFMSVYLA